MDPYFNFDNFWRINQSSFQRLIALQVNQILKKEVGDIHALVKNQFEMHFGEWTSDTSIKNFEKSGKEGDSLHYQKLNELSEQIKELKEQISMIGSSKQLSEENRPRNQSKHPKYFALEYQLRKERNEQISKITSMVDPKSLFFGRFQIDGTIVEYSKQHEIGMHYHLFGRTNIKMKGSNSFTLVETKDGSIRVGIANKKYLGDKCMTGKKQCIFYSAYDGSLYVSGKYMGNKKGAMEGETIVMNVLGDKIVWSVGTEIRNEYQHYMINDSSVEWVPFIMMARKGDKIKWE